MPSDARSTPSPAQQLLGRTLNQKWKVIEHLGRHPDATGSHFSESYLVEGRDGRQAFLKALDFAKVPPGTDVARWLELQTRAFNHECDLLELCKERRMDRIVRALDRGQEEFYTDRGVAGYVPFLVLECADQDLRLRTLMSERFDTAVKVRILHQVAKGLQQLHGGRIAHQDLKPSNVVLFGDLDARLTDLGSASHRERPAPQDDRQWAGDGNYTPMELLYQGANPEWGPRRLGCDAYMLGALVVFLFTGAQLNAQILRSVPRQQQPSYWDGTYAEVLPLIRAGFGAVLAVLQQRLEAAGSPQLLEVVAQLCEPDPARRGHPKTLGSAAQQYDLARYVSLFDLLASRLGRWHTA